MDSISKAIPADELARMQAKAPAPAPAVTFADPSMREMQVPLNFPVMVGGNLVEKVSIRRPTMREWRAYLRACQTAVANDGPGADDLVDQPWLSVPASVLESLDFIDAARVESAMEDFTGGSQSQAAAPS